MKALLTAIDRAVYWLSFMAAMIAAAILVTIFVIVQYEVVMRYVFNSPTFWTNEVSTFAISWVGFLGAGYILRIGRQLEIDVITMRLSEKGRRNLGTLTDLLAMVFCGYVTYLGYKFVSLSYLMQASSASELDVPLWIPYLAIPIGFAILTLELFTRLAARWGLVEGRTVGTEMPVH